MKPLDRLKLVCTYEKRVCVRAVRDAWRVIVGHKFGTLFVLLLGAISNYLIQRMWMGPSLAIENARLALTSVGAVAILFVAYVVVALVQTPALLDFEVRGAHKAQIEQIGRDLDRTAKERDEAKAALERAKAQRSDNGPRVVPTKFDKNPEYFRGLFIRNFGEPAYDVSIPPIMIGKCRATFDCKGERSMLTDSDGEAYYDVWIDEAGKPGRAGALFEVMQENRIPSVEFKIKYKDFEQQWYVTNGTFEVDVTAKSGIIVGHTGRSHLSDDEAALTNVVQEWKDLAARFEKADGRVRADWQCNRRNNETVLERWEVKGSFGSAEVETLCRYAGALLCKSRGLNPAIKRAIGTQLRPADTWLYFLKDSHGALRYNAPGFAIGTDDDGGKTLYLMGSIEALAAVSARICLECAAAEL